jgi:hypothetical protein
MNVKSSKSYNSWAAMIQRCTNPNRAGYKDYGGRGIGVCERWSSFANFLADMGERPAGMSLERIDTDGSYEPSNCKWATRLEQSRNRKWNNRIEYLGSVKLESDWCRERGFKPGAIRKRLLRGWTVEQAMTHTARERV